MFNENSTKHKKILVHCCCGPCSTICLKRLAESGWECVVCFGNSNIFPYQENQKRWENLLKVAEFYHLNTYRINYNHSLWLDFVKTLENENEGGKRCLKCFEFNFRETVRIARELGIKYVTTTLTVSPYKKSENIFKIWDYVLSSEKSDIHCEKINFKKKNGYSESIELSKQLDLYRQEFCGCEFSKRFAVAEKIKKEVNE